ncbi:hypothetical protein HF086_012777 [Spodoptera exigua]|uniref:Uncharacterized protein n=1 Tax=Spodoptera exigua TaxID=7107 RepID=A0A922SIZ4_SPOEX|nr:hypothetical protein HF086_012777 [Spodoptera exigua]
MDRNRGDEQILAWLMEKGLEDIEDPSFRADVIESDRGGEHSHHSTNTEQSSSEVEGEVSSISPGNQLCYVGKDGCTKWNYDPLRSNVRTRAHNIVEKQPGGPILKRERLQRDRYCRTESLYWYFVHGWYKKDESLKFERNVGRRWHGT